MTQPDRSEQAGSLPVGLKGPRADVVMELKGQGSLTAKDLSARLGLSMNAVRHHMKEAIGVVWSDHFVMVDGSDDLVVPRA